MADQSHNPNVLEGALMQGSQKHLKAPTKILNIHLKPDLVPRVQGGPM